MEDQVGRHVVKVGVDEEVASLDEDADAEQSIAEIDVAVLGADVVFLRGELERRVLAQDEIDEFGD